MRDESFGPIIGIQKVADDAAAVALMNDTEYGLTAGVYTRDERRAKRILAQVQRGVGVLELLRPREPAAAVVRRRALGHRPHAVDLRHRRRSRGRRRGICAARDPSVAGLARDPGPAHAFSDLAVAQPGLPQLCVARCASCNSAARSVLASSVAIVIGPTPPGTGVIHRRASFAAAKSTSPHSLPSARAIDADVDDDRARLDPVALHELRACRRRRRRCPPAARGPAGRASSSGRRSPCSAPSAAPAPSAGRRCSTARSRPHACRRDPRRSPPAASCSRRACTGRSVGRFSTSRPMLYGWKPSTSLSGVDALGDELVVDVLRQRQLDQDAVDRGIVRSARRSAPAARPATSSAGRS